MSSMLSFAETSNGNFWEAQEIKGFDERITIIQVVEYQTPGAGWDSGCKAPPGNRSLGITRRPVPQGHK